MKRYSPDERNPLLLLELVSAVLTSATGLLSVAALLGVVRWLA